MQVTFLVAPQFVPKESWQEALLSGKKLQVASSGNAATAQNMTYQTWFWLHQAGISCQLAHSLPKEGIVIFVSNTFSPKIVLPPHLFCVDILADTTLLPSTHLHLIQNRVKAKWTPYSLFVPHWPQPSLIPRNRDRGTRFEQVSFFGDPYNIAPELQSPNWRQELRRELGMFLSFKSSSQWHDYSETDAIIAIRDFSTSPYYQKPATKLYNAWLAGVPFIGGRDSAYAADGRPGVDYLVAKSPQQVIEHLRQLKDNLVLRSQLVHHGTISGASFSREATLAQWKYLVEEKLPALAIAWRKKTALRKRFFWTIQKSVHILDLRLKKQNQDVLISQKIIPGINHYLK